MEDLMKYFMKFPQTIIIVVIFFGAGCLSFLFHVLKNREEFSLKQMVKHCVPYDAFHSKSVWMDAKMNVIHWLMDATFYAPGVIVFAVVSDAIDKWLLGLGAHYTAPQPGYLSASVCMVAIFVALELSDYVVHYAEHKIPILWELHKVHHSADIVNPLTARREHLIPIIYTGISAGIIVGATSGILMFLFNISLVEAIALRLFVSKMGSLLTLGPLKHSHIPVGLGWFDKILISPHMHQVHHSKLQQHWDKNFGNSLSIFDWLFHTGYKPVKGEEIVFGIAGYSDAELQKFNTLFGAFISPILRIGVKIRQGIGTGRKTVPTKLPNDRGEAIAAVERVVKPMPSAPV